MEGGGKQIVQPEWLVFFYHTYYNTVVCLQLLDRIHALFVFITQVLYLL